MTNPTLLFWDSDALIQFLLTNAVSPLRTLRTNYGIQSVIVPEVEIELLSSRRFAHLIPSLKKATGNKLIEVLDEPTYFRLLGDLAPLRADAVGTSYGDIQTLGRQYNQRIDTGESYTFAAALTLHQPACSNDWSAIRTHLSASLPLPFSVQRAYDVLVFAHQIGLMPEKECD